MMNGGYKNITLQQMETLVCLVEERSFSAAAKRMYLTQPALTKNIRKMEDALDAKVVNRSSTGTSLTPEGKILYDVAKKMIKLRREAEEKIRQMQETTGGDIYMAASTIPSTYILPKILSALKDAHPDIRIFLKTEDSEEVMNMVLDKSVEIGCIGKKPLDGKIIAEPLWNDRLALVVPAHHRWAQKGIIDLADLLQENFILREKGSATREVLENYLKENKSIPLSRLKICGELGSSEAIKEAVLAGLGVSVLSVHAVERELSSRLLAEISIADFSVERKFYLIYLKPFELRPAHQIFVSFLKKYPPGSIGRN